jgi:hypothetical protein
LRYLLSRNLPLKRPISPFCMGRPGGVRTWPMPWDCSHAMNARLVNSGPLSSPSVAGRWPGCLRRNPCSLCPSPEAGPEAFCDLFTSGKNWSASSWFSEGR